MSREVCIRSCYRLWRSPRGTTLYILPNAIWCLFDSRMAPRAIQNLPRHQSRSACAEQAQETSLAPRRIARRCTYIKPIVNSYQQGKQSEGWTLTWPEFIYLLMCEGSVLPCRNSPSGVRPCITLNVPRRVQRV
uniref:Uncharacterized protein n=1 Tax=Trichogramma kaykai TaxID=54128 RepID=A0ABD2X0F1_9HYME